MKHTTKPTAISLGKPYDIEAVEFTGEWRAELS